MQLFYARLLLVLAGSISLVGASTEGYGVHWTGTLRAVHQGDTAGTLSLQTFAMPIVSPTKNTWSSCYKN